ncbi:MAG: M13 family metallopeptidase [Ignavibacteria bacterium]|nr:M13 family metallopeptidase [Ignavibacteria bacterium]
MKIKFLLIFAVAIFQVFSTASYAQEHHHSTGSGRGINPEDIDSSVDPNVDFYRYSSGNWLKNNSIPPEYSSWSDWRKIDLNNEKLLKEILEEVTANPMMSSNSNAKMLGDIYYTALDTLKIESDGMNPVKEDLALIDGISNKEDFIKVFSQMKQYRNGGLFSFWVGQDDKNSANVIMQLFQGGIGLPEKDYYFKDDPKSKEIREKYRQFMENIFVLIGNDRNAAAKISRDVMVIETRLARASMSRIDMREAEATYHPMTLQEVKALTPDFSWNVLFEIIGIGDERNFEKGINVGQPEFFKEVNRMLTDVSVNDWKNYLKWNLMRSAADKLSRPFADESFNYYSKTLRGVEQQRERWRNGIEYVEDAMGEALGQMFVAKSFKPEAKQRALEMVANIKEAFKDRILMNEWMSEETKKQALKKLGTFDVKIGYTDKWRDFAGLKIDRSSLYNNMKQAAIFNQQYNLNKIGKPVDRTEWWMLPQTVNAYYSSSKNEIVFPAGIMQPPFFDPDADDAVNYGGIGMVIGHEITHGFDDQGRKYDGEGNMSDWWTEIDAAKFKERADKLVKQYNNFKVADDLNINGELTLGENIADLGGLIVAYYGLQKALEGKERKLIDGFTQEQRFFLSNTNVWRTLMRPETMRLLVTTDSHSPGEFRVTGPMSNMEEFMKAFGGKPGDPMVRTGNERVVIW